MRYKAVKTQEELIDILSAGDKIKKYAFQNLEFKSVEGLIGERKFYDCLFLGCQLGNHLLKDFKDCLIFPELGVPFNVFTNTLYTNRVLYGEYELGAPESFYNTFDQRVYRRFLDKGQFPDDVGETLARSLHDNSITDALHQFLGQYDERKVVGIMGGHGIARNEDSFLDVARISKCLTEKGFLMVSGGGPGAMEATHLGAWFAGKAESDFQKAINVLSEAPKFTDKQWLDKAMEVLYLYPTSDFHSVGVPTWHYGHEPSTPFASHIAKYFANSIREDGLLSIAKGGVIYTPGSAGTMQEIFQEATQNHYKVFGYSSPMAFYNKQYWTENFPVYPFLVDLQDQGKYKNLILSLNDTIEEVVSEIVRFTQTHN